MPPTVYCSNDYETCCSPPRRYRRIAREVPLKKKGGVGFFTAA